MTTIDETERQEYVRRGLSYLGRPYVWGANGPWHVDCSGLKVAILREMGKIGPSDDFSAQGFYMLAQPTIAPRPGDWAFYGRDKSHVSHIASLIDDTRVLSASGGNSKTTSPLIALKMGAAVKIHSTPLYRPDFLGFGINPFLEDRTNVGNIPAPVA